MAAAGPLLPRAHGHPAIARLALALAIALALVGCGSERSADGRAVFRRDCSTCHTLTGREHGAIGGDLVNAHLGVRALASFARIMPVRPRLDAGEANAVARYVHAVASTHRGR